MGIPSIQTIMKFPMGYIQQTLQKHMFSLFIVVGFNA